MAGFRSATVIVIWAVIGGPAVWVLKWDESCVPKGKGRVRIKSHIVQAGT
jgi:hypothetical protein